MNDHNVKRVKRAKHVERQEEQPLHDEEIRTLDESDMKVIKGSWGCSITWNHRSIGGTGGLGGGGLSINGG